MFEVGLSPSSCPPLPPSCATPNPTTAKKKADTPWHSFTYYFGNQSRVFLGVRSTARSTPSRRPAQVRRQDRRPPPRGPAQRSQGIMPAGMALEIFPAALIATGLLYLRYCAPKTFSKQAIVDKMKTNAHTGTVENEN